MSVYALASRRTIRVHSDSLWYTDSTSWVDSLQISPQTGPTPFYPNALHSEVCRSHLLEPRLGRQAVSPASDRFHLPSSLPEEGTTKTALTVIHVRLGL